MKKLSFVLAIIFILSSVSFTVCASPAKGDADGDGEVTFEDYIRIRLAADGKAALDSSSAAASDIDGNGKTDANDCCAVKNNVLFGTPLKISSGLLFKSDGSGSCVVSGIGSCRDREIVIPSVSPNGDAVTGIADQAFINNKTVVSVTVPFGVTSIGVGAFAYCTALNSVTLPGTVVSVFDMAFYNTALYNNKSNWKDGILYIGNQLIKAEKTISGALSVRESTVCIADSAFDGCAGLESVSVPVSVTALGLKTFYDCTSLKSVAIPASVTKIGDFAFYGCVELTDITVPENTEYIGEFAFYYCMKLPGLSLPASVRTIGSGAFEGCKGFTAFTVPEKVTSINYMTFYECENLKSVSIPAGVRIIGNEAFYNCRALTDVYFAGSSSDWKAVTVGSTNDFLTDAAIHCKG